MANESNPQAPTVGIIADRDLYLSERGEVVEKGDQEARTLLAARGSFIEPAHVAKHGLKASGGKIQVASPKERAKAAEEAGMPLDLGTPNEGQLREPGEPLILVPRTGTLKPAMVAAERIIPEEGEEFDPAAARRTVVSNVPKEDDELRAKVAEETRDDKARERAREEEADRAAQPGGARKGGAKKAGRKSGRKSR